MSDLADVRAIVRMHIQPFWVRIPDEADVETLRDDGLAVSPEPSLGDDVYRVEW